MAKRFPTTPANKLRFKRVQEFEDEVCAPACRIREQGWPRHPWPPVPVDEMVELYLGLSLEFLDMQKLFGVDDVHGALWVNEKRVGIDQRLDPARNPRHARPLSFHASP